MAKKTKSFEEALSRLEEIVDAMEEGELSLDETVKLYRRRGNGIRMLGEAFRRQTADKPAFRRA